MCHIRSRGNWLILLSYSLPPFYAINLMLLILYVIKFEVCKENIWKTKDFHRFYSIKLGYVAMWRRIAVLLHRRIQSRLCGDFPRINVVDMFMRRRATHKAKIAFMWRNGPFFRIKRLNLSYVYYEAKQNKVLITRISKAFDIIKN